MMLLNKQSLLALASLCVLSRTSTADKTTSINEFDLIRRTMESINLKELHKKRTFSLLRNLEVSQTCLDETTALYEKDEIATYLDNLETTLESGFTESDLYTYCEVDINREKKSVSADCDFELMFPGLEEVCESHGGQYFTMKITISGKENGVKTKLVWNDIGDCAGPSCDLDEVFEEVKQQLDETVEMLESQGYTVKISASYLKSTYYALGAAVVSTMLAIFFI